MNRTGFLKNIFGLGLLSVLGCQIDSKKAKSSTPLGDTESLEEQKAIAVLREELKTAWLRSEIMTMTNVSQMPSDFFTFKYADEAMTFAEQWRHCIVYTCGQLAGRAGLKNPYENIKLPVQMTKDHLTKELKKMYAFVRQSIEVLSDQKLLSDCNFAGDTIPIWRLYYAMENHIIHHRGQCVVYLRLKGIIPKGFYGW
ncbi:DinB family protein [Ulvibacterium sp.]|uniref:DinB family protein n=1 Tax=Ulvibacterium sp. TaxID=2665914 RepID=UPI002622F9CE|nr:DinB family protein [Ulvibacterium sp.]